MYDQLFRFFVFKNNDTFLQFKTQRCYGRYFKFPHSAACMVNSRSQLVVWFFRVGNLSFLLNPPFLKVTHAMLQVVNIYFYPTFAVWKN